MLHFTKPAGPFSIVRARTVSAVTHIACHSSEVQHQQPHSKLQAQPDLSAQEAQKIQNTPNYTDSHRHHPHPPPRQDRRSTPKPAQGNSCKAPRPLTRFHSSLHRAPVTSRPAATHLGGTCGTNVTGGSGKMRRELLDKTSIHIKRPRNSLLIGSMRFSRALRETGRQVKHSLLPS